MRFKRTVEAHVEERVEDTRRTCDGCGGLADATKGFEASEVEIGACIGDVFPDADFRVAYEIDVCGACFLKKVVPALEAVGLRFRMRGVDQSLHGGDDGRVWDPEAISSPPDRGA